MRRRSTFDPHERDVRSAGSVHMSCVEQDKRKIARGEEYSGVVASRRRAEGKIHEKLFTKSTSQKYRMLFFFLFNERVARDFAGSAADQHGEVRRLDDGRKSRQIRDKIVFRS